MSRLEFKSVTKRVPIPQLAISPVAQRRVNKERVEVMTAAFDLDLVGTPIVSFRDGKYFVIDGQHRILSLKQWLGDVTDKDTIDCKVFNGLTEAQEAHLFLRFNETLRVNPFDKFERAVVAGHKDEVLIKRLVEAEGLKIVRNMNQRGGITSITTLMKMLDRGASVLTKTLRTLHTAYGDNGFEGAVMDGVSQVIARYGPELKMEKLVSRLGEARGGVKGLINRANEIQLRVGGNRGNAVAAAVVDTYNQDPKGGRIQTWWKQGT